MSSSIDEHEEGLEIEDKKPEEEITEEPEETGSEQEHEPEHEPESELDPRPYMRDEEPTGETNKAKYWLMHGLTDEEIVEDKNLNPRTVGMARGELIKEGLMKKGRKPPAGKQKQIAEKALTNRATEKSMQIFAKGSPPEAIIESIKIPEAVDGNALVFESGMKFGMSTLVLATRIMQELSAIGMQQVKPLIDMTRSVREGETAAFKSGADEGAQKAAQAMGNTMMPLMSEMMAKVETATKGSSDADPMKAMMARTMEPIMKGMLGKFIPGMGDEAPVGWTKKQE